MNLTNELLAEYVGGHLEIINHVENYICRGKVAKAAIIGNELHVKWDSIRQLNKIDGTWELVDNKVYQCSLVLLSPPSRMPHARDGTDRLVMVSQITNETLAFHHPKGESVQNLEERWQENSQ